MISSFIFQILNTKVIFSAQRTTWGNVQGDLHFNQVDINIGGGFGGKIFTAPISGIYKMTFSGISGFNQFELYMADFTSIIVKKNNQDMFYIFDGNENGKGEDQNNISYTWMLELIKGDEVKLWSDNYVFVSTISSLTFTGELIHID